MFFYNKPFLQIFSFEEQYFLSKVVLNCFVNILNAHLAQVALSEGGECDFEFCEISHKRNPAINCFQSPSDSYDKQPQNDSLCISQRLTMIPALGGDGIKQPKLNCSFSAFCSWQLALNYLPTGREACLYTSFVELLKSSETGTCRARWSGVILLLHRHTHLMVS